MQTKCGIGSLHLLDVRSDALQMRLSQHKQGILANAQSLSPHLDLLGTLLARYIQNPVSLACQERGQLQQQSTLAYARVAAD